MFRKEIFEKVGLYDENLIRNQDDDFNYRVGCAGEKVFISPRAWSCYYVREAPSLLFRQYFEYGYWRVAVLRKHRLPASIRQVVPVTFFLLVFITVILGIYLPEGWRSIAAALPLAYALILIFAGVGVARRCGTVVGAMFPLAAAIMHIAYAAGFVRGVMNGRAKDLVKPPFERRTA
jgi:hypothetical protein